ncbi:serine/threonine-protein kinase [Mycolicibacterium sp. 120270]|uniref:serine/threonine-protein kinase n=1 Tax=Mycolicibacterium sp. 120270 TaxID=3090600 RepID=UPI00299EA7CE|nr:serine/threonine-protein kinase [Mycolicibacterium sp. 120270]MDX1883313.1 serine/threonine-protein kinase [Mycolicibacterium sp. 120270]
MASPQGTSRLGSKFGPYELQSLIGVGGMGEVYRAYDTVRERMVAVKLLRPEMAADKSYQERFRRESRVAARLQEPHVIPVHDFGEIDGTLYIDMRLVEGASLKEELRANGPLEPKRAASIISQVAAALDAAHADKLVHRDIKPENVLLTPEDFAYLVDFGIAHAGGDASVTSTGLIIGSCAYMAAERFAGGQVGPAADIYSLTCLLYECLTGRAPFETGGDLRQLMSAHMFSPPPRPSMMRPGISRAFDDVITKGMAKQPSDRYPTAGALAKAATAAAGSALPPRPPLPAPSPPASTRQFTSVYENPSGTGYTPYPPAVHAPTPVPPPDERKRRFGRTRVALVAATVALFGVAAILATILMWGGGDTDTTRRTQLAAPPPRTTTVTTTAPSDETTTTTTTTPSSPTTSAAPLAGMTGMDGQGFIGHTTRCDPGATPVAAIETSLSMAIICETSPGTYQYRGERLRDGANIQLNNATPNGSGFDAVNPTDGARYEVRPDRLRILSNGGVDSDEPALQYGTR